MNAITQFENQHLQSVDQDNLLFQQYMGKETAPTFQRMSSVPTDSLEAHMKLDFPDYDELLDNYSEIAESPFENDTTPCFKRMTNSKPINFDDVLLNDEPMGFTEVS